MSFKRIKKIAIFCAMALAVVLLKKFCYRQTDGFAIYKICSNFSFHPEWEIPSATLYENTELQQILNQPFYYLAKGAQSYVFASADGRSVIKFFRLYHLTPPSWITHLSFPLPLMPYKLQKILDKRQELDKDFQSYKIAFEEMKEETGLIYMHLNKSDRLHKKLTIYDRLGIAHQLDLDQMEFLVQKKATLVFPSIDSLMQTEGTIAAKQAISDLVKLLLTRCEKGIFDKDPDLNTNFGFLGATPVQIDIGRFRKQSEQKKVGKYRDEILRITDNFRQWLDTKYPPLSEHLLNEIHQIAT